nr:hypothetical protein [Rhizobium sp. FKY42]
MQVHCLIAASVAFLTIASSQPAAAISRYNSTSMTCAAAQERIAREGAVIFRYPGRTGMTLYDRYVSSDRYCAGGEYAKPDSIPTKDVRNCPVRQCEMRPSPGDCDSFLDEGCFGWR